MAARELTMQVSLNGPGITLADLRWLIEQCTSYDGESRVECRGRRDHGPRETEPERIVVHGVAPKPDLIPNR